MSETNTTTNTTANTEFVSSEEKRFAEKEFNLVGGVTAEFDLVDKTTSFSFTDVAPEDSVMGIGISHTYKKSAEDFNVGQNFRLNVNEKFVKDSTGTYIYTDDKGDKHKFIKYHYKKVNGNKVYVDVAESDVTVETDGSLTYEGQEIFAEYRSALGLKAVTELDDYKKFALYEERSDELKQLEEQVNSYKTYLEDFVVVTKSTGVKDREFKDVLSGETQYESFESVIQSDYKIVLTSVEHRQYTMLYQQKRKIEGKLSGGEYFTPKTDGTEEESIYAECVPLKLSLNELNEKAKYFANGIVATAENEAAKNCILDDLKYNFKIMAGTMDLVFQGFVEATYNGESWTKEDVFALIRERNIVLAQYNHTTNQIAYQIESLQNQITILEEKKANYVEQIERYYKEYYNKSKELEKAKRDLPENFLSDGKIARAYSVDGRLVAVYDKYENYAVLEYDRFNQNRLNRIIDNNNKEVKFEYNTDGKLISITDAKGNKTEYTYSGTNLHEIKPKGEYWLDVGFGQNDLYIYDEKNEKSSVLTFTNEILTKIGSYSSIKDIDKAGYEYADSTDYGDKIWECEVSYGSKIKDDLFIYDYIDFTCDGVTERYCVINGRLIRLIKIESGVVVDAEGYQFVPYYINGVKQQDPREKFTKAPKSTLYTTSPEEFDLIDGEKAESTLNQFNNPTKTVVSGTVINANGDTKTTTTYYEYDDEQRVVKEDITESYLGNTFVTHKTYTYNEKGELVKTETFVDGEEFTNGKDIEERVYDKFGNQIKSFRYNSLDASSKFYTESIYDEKGTLTAELDSTGENKTEYNINENTSEVLEEKLPNGSKFAYGYDKEGRVTAISQSTEEGEENSTQKTYSYGELVEAKSANTTANYTYDGKRRVTKIGLNGNANYIQKTYTDDTTLNGVTVDKVVITNAKGETITKYVDKSGKVRQVEYSGGTKLIYSYDQRGKVINIQEMLDNTVIRTLEYVYDDFDNLIDYTERINGNVTINEGISRGANNEENMVFTCGRTDYLYLKNDSKKRIDNIEIGNLTSAPKYDILGRNKGRVISGLNEGKLASEKISYRKVGDHATNMPSSIIFGERVDASTLIDKEKISYSYDKLGNIEKVYLNGALSIRYSYDKLGRLVREDNKPLNKTTVYHYDNNGNILRQKEYAFTFKNSLELEELPCTEKTYSYDGDKMLSFNGEACTYDLIGNPTTYRGKSATWSNGRNMTAFDGHTFTYDGLGRRATKDSLTFTYDRKGRLLSQSNGLTFGYDHTGVFTLFNNNNQYFYRKDIQGNIIAVLDTNGIVLARYIYDAWGNHKVVDNAGAEITDQTHVGNLNPFRYRGYYFDTETGLYFLKTRYYDPQVCRFITIDSIEYIDPETINGLNLYAYCGNNPVMNIDPDGHAWWHWVLGGVLLVGAIVLSIVTAGAASGTILAAVHVLATAAAISGTTAAVAGTISGGLKIENGKTSWDWEGASRGFLSGAVTGVVSGAITGGLGGLGSSASIVGKMAIQGGVNALLNAMGAVVSGVIVGELKLEHVIISALSGFFSGALSSSQLKGTFLALLLSAGAYLASTFNGDILNLIIDNLKVFD